MQIWPDYTQLTLDVKMKGGGSIPTSEKLCTVFDSECEAITDSNAHIEPLPPVSTIIRRLAQELGAAFISVI